MIRAYPDRVSVFSGEPLVLRVSTNARRFRVRVFRCGMNVEEVQIPRKWFAGECPPAGDAAVAWDWPRCEIDLPRTMRPGVYIAALETDPPHEAVRPDRRGATPDARSARALFVVRDIEKRAGLLLALPLFTYHAYNVADVDGTRGEGEGDCLYSGAKWVSLHRPGGGVGGHPWDEVNEDVYDIATPRQTFAHWDAKAIAWLERVGYSYDCCTDLDLHDGSIDVTSYRAIASFGHHEYWTRPMRDCIALFVAEGGNVAFFGGNTCWFEAEYDEHRHAIRRVGRWTDDPEWKFTGVTYAFGGGKWIGPRPRCGYRVTNARHWIFKNLDLHEGDIFGSEERMIGYECDGAPPQSDLEIAADASIGDWPVSDGSGEVSPHARAALGVRQTGGIVFTASTVDWARVLYAGEPHVGAITRNVLNRFIR